MSVADGSKATTRTLGGSSAGISTAYYSEIVLDAKNRRIYVPGGSGKVLVFNNADTVTGNVAPDRTMTVAGGATALALDTTTDTLYVVSAGAISTVANASTASGSVAAKASLTSPGSVYGLWSDAVNDRLYLTNNNTIAVYDGVSKLSGTVASPNRAVSASGNNSPYGVTVDAVTDTLYISSRNQNQIFALTGGSKANGTVVPARTLLDATGLSQVMNIGFANDTLFTLNDGGNKWHVYAKAGSLSGTVTATRTLTTTLNSLGGFAYAP